MAEVERWQATGDDAHALASSAVGRFLVPGDADPEAPMSDGDIARMRAAARELARVSYEFAGHYRRMAVQISIADNAQGGGA